MRIGHNVSAKLCRARELGSIKHSGDHEEEQQRAKDFLHDVMLGYKQQLKTPLSPLGRYSKVRPPLGSRHSCGLYRDSGQWQ